jgi:hypothetical protein
MNIGYDGCYDAMRPGGCSHGRVYLPIAGAADSEAVSEEVFLSSGWLDDGMA